MNQKSKTVLVWGFVPILAAVMTVGVRYTWDRWFESTPRLECPHTLDLGDRERGETAIGRFQIGNSGRATLSVTDFSTSCSCAGVERDINGRFNRVESIRLLPGEKIDLLVRVGVSARLGQSQLVHISFATNDPAQPMGQLEVIIPRVAGGYISEPSAVVFSSFPLGKTPNQIINLYDNGNPGRSVVEVHSTRPNHFTATLLPFSEKDKHVVHQSAGKLFARITVTAHSKLPGHFDGEVQISLNDEKHSTLPIPVLGEVVNLAEPRPSILVLPRYVGNKSVRTGEVLIFNRHEKPIDVVVDSLPSDFVAKLKDVPGHPDQCLLNIEWNPDRKRKQKSLTEVRIRLHVRCESEETKLEVPVLLKEDQS